MAVTYSQARVILQQAIADSSNQTFADQCLDQAQVEVARARRWPELMVPAFFNTVAAYETGTVAVTNGGTTWTLTSGTFPTDVATGGYRIALSVSGPWYTITTRTSGTSVETAAYQGDTETAASYVAYKSHYSLAAAVERVESMWLHDTGNAVELDNVATDRILSEFVHYPYGPGTPTRFLPIERDSSGYAQVLLGPETPDAVYRVEYLYRKKVTDGTFVGNLDETRWPLILQKAKEFAYEPEFYERSIAAGQKYDGMLAKAWAEEGDVEQQSVVVGSTRIAYPGILSHMDGLMGRGTVQDPS